jgi:DNA-directed RNA polymerase subunit RPC12/RpoP
MSEKDSLHGLACPRCGGMVTIPEGQMIVKCPYCDLRSMVRGDRGIQRFQVPNRINREQALNALRRFLTSSRAIATSASKEARLVEDFVVYLPYWMSWERVLGWVFGKKKVGSGNDTKYRPKEVKVVQDMHWNGAACDVGEFGVLNVPYTNQALEVFNPDILHETGMVFEPVSSLSDARTSAQLEYAASVQQTSGLDQIAQVFQRSVRRRFGMVYYPLWVMRYLFHGRSFQVVVDGYSGQVLYGKAPGNALYRGAVLVGGMAIGAFLAVDVSSLAFYLGSQSDSDCSGVFVFGLAMIAAGFGLMLKVYNTFRYGEHYEYRLGSKKGDKLALDIKDMISQVQEVSSWARQ